METNTATATPSPSEVFDQSGAGDQQQQQSGDQSQQSQSGQQQQQSQPLQPVITPEAIAAAVKAAMPPPPQQPERPPSPEDIAAFEKQFNVVKVTPDVYKAILGVAPQNADQCKALEQLLHGAAKQGISMASYLMQQKMDERFQQLEGRLSPMQEYVNQQAVQRLEADFTMAYPDLKDHGALVREVALATKAQNIPFKSRQEAFDFVANKARSLLGKAAPAGNNSASNRQQSRPSTQRFNMPTTSLGGNPGSGRSPQAGGNTIRPQDVFKDEAQ